MYYLQHNLSEGNLDFLDGRNVPDIPENPL